MPRHCRRRRFNDDDDIGGDGDDVGGGVFRDGTELISDRSRTMASVFFPCENIKDFRQNKQDIIRNRVRLCTHHNNNLCVYTYRGSGYGSSGLNKYEKQFLRGTYMIAQHGYSVKSWRTDRTGITCNMYICGTPIIIVLYY
jgi:hypothetical protein